MRKSPILMKVDSVRIDDGTQSRVEINEAAFEEYAEALESGDQFPAVVVFEDGIDFWWANGVRRRAGRRFIPTQVGSEHRRHREQRICLR